MATWIDPTVDVKLEIAFSTDPLATTPTYTDVSAYLRRDGVTISRGTTSEDSSIGPGFATFTLDNRDRRFDPDYSSGAYYPNVKPMRRVKLTVTKSAAVVVFTGFVMSWQNDWTLDDGVSIVRCVDSMWWLANKQLGNSAYEAEVLADSPIHYWQTNGTRLVDIVGGLDIELDPISSLIRSYSADSIVQADIGFPLGGDAAVWDTAGYVSPALTVQPMALEFWVKPRFTSDCEFTVIAQVTDTQVLEFSYIGSAGIYLHYLNAADDRDLTTTVQYEMTSGRRYHFALWADTTNLYLMINGTTTFTLALNVNVWSPGIVSVAGVLASSFTSASDAGICQIAVYETAPSGSRFQQHYITGLLAFGGPAYRERGGARIGRILDEIGWSSSLRSLDTGNFGHGQYLPAGQLAIDYIRSVVDVERGLFFCDRTGNLAFVDLTSRLTGSATGKVFSDDGGAGAIKYTQPFSMSPASVDTIRNVVTVSYSTTGAITRRDSASEDSYGSSRLFIDGPTIGRARDASAVADFELAERKDPSTRVESITVLWRNGTATDTTNAIDTCSAVELGDVVTVEITPRGVGSQVVKTCQVVGIEHEITKEMGVTTLYMRPAPTQSGWFTLGSSSLDGTDVLLP